jgi:predicted nucleic acid-binding protein
MYASERRARRSGRRPVADVLIGALARRHAGLITRHVDDFRGLYPGLRLVNPIDPTAAA